MLRIWVDMNFGGHSPTQYRQQGAASWLTPTRGESPPSQIPPLSGPGALRDPPAGRLLPCTLTGSCSLSSEVALVVDLAQVG